MTWRALAKHIATLSPKQLKDSVRFVPGGDDNKMVVIKSFRTSRQYPTGYEKPYLSVIPK